jgi:hypothetical protein
MRRLWGSVKEVPDFTKIPPGRWEEAMRTIPAHLRLASVQQVSLPLEQASALIELALSDLPAAPSDRARDAILTDPRLAPIPPRKRVRNADRQVNFRLTRDEYADLLTAAEILGYSPGRLARELVRAGMQRVIEEANRPGG